jgi:UDP-galactopyranose mutase
MKRALVLGGGFSGCCSAHLLSDKGWEVTLIEKAPFLGGGNKTRYLGGHPYTFGPRHFLTTWTNVYEFLNKYVPLRSCSEHEFLTYVETDNSFYGYPIHQDDLPKMPDYEKINTELDVLRHINSGGTTDAGAINKYTGAKNAKNLEDYWINSIGDTLYNKFVNNYSKKMWMLDDNSLIDEFGWSPKGATIKQGPRAAWDQSISAYPIASNGYDDYFDISTRNVKVHLSTVCDKYDIQSKSVWIKGEKLQFDIIINTISPDILFEFCFGELPYVGRELIPIVLPTEYVFPKNVYMVYYAGAENYTRAVEYKKFTKHSAPTSLITIEIPSRKNKLYPLPINSERAIAKKYLDLMPEGVYSIGRMGGYSYNVDIDDTIEQSMRVVSSL